MEFRFLPIFRIFSILFTSVVLMLSAFLPFVSVGEVLYVHDDAGRLVRAVKGTEGVTYKYDQVGNLLSISRGKTGQNLLRMTRITSDNPQITIKNISV